MLEVIEKNSKYITLRMPIKLSRGIFGSVDKNSKKGDSYDFPTIEEKKIFKRYKNVDITKLKDARELIKKYR